MHGHVVGKLNGLGALSLSSGNPRRIWFSVGLRS